MEQAAVISLAIIAIVLGLYNLYKSRSRKQRKKTTPGPLGGKKITRTFYPGWKTCEAVGRGFGMRKNVSSQIRDICTELNLETRIIKNARFMKIADIPYIEERLKEKNGEAKAEPTLFEIRPEWVSGPEMMKQFGIKHKNVDYYHKRYNIERKGKAKHYLYKQADIDRAVKLRKEQGLQ